MPRGFPIAVPLVLLLILASTCVFTVTENELAIRTQFREIISSQYEPGLHFKTPIDTVIKFERRIVSQSFQGETFLTSENRSVIVDFYVKWRIRDAGRYYQSFGTNEGAASQRLSDIVKDGIKNAVAQRTLQQIVAAERAAFTGQMFGRASKTVQDLGLELIDVRVQRIDLPEDVASRVYASMQQSFERLARQLRGEGEKDALRIRAEADRKRTEILSAAARDALKIRGEADSLAAAVYAQAYNKNPEFYSFYRSLQAYKNSLGKDGDVLVVSPDSEFFRYLRSPGGGTRRHVARPRQMFQWPDLAAAVALFLVLEGVVPFLDPARMKRALLQLIQVPDSQLRIAGLGSIVVGLALLAFVRA